MFPVPKPLNVFDEEFCDTCVCGVAPAYAIPNSSTTIKCVPIYVE